MRDRIIRNIEDNIALKRKMASDDVLLKSIELTTRACVQALRKGGKILLCGNGGSAADAQHIAAELSGRFQRERPALFAEALTVNTSSLTAISNDYGFEYVFSRQIEAMGKKNDVLWALSTSGKSANVLNALKQARQNKMTCVGLTGATASGMGDLCDILLRVPANNTARIQEAHILIGHLVCELLEEELFG